MRNVLRTSARFRSAAFLIATAIFAALWWRGLHSPGKSQFSFRVMGARHTLGCDVSNFDLKRPMVDAVSERGIEWARRLSNDDVVWGIDAQWTTTSAFAFASNDCGVQASFSETEGFAFELAARVGGRSLPGWHRRPARLQAAG
jgi:hypothetical protein